MSETAVAEATAEVQRCQREVEVERARATAARGELEAVIAALVETDPDDEEAFRRRAADKLNCEARLSAIETRIRSCERAAALARGVLARAQAEADKARAVELTRKVHEDGEAIRSWLKTEIVPLIDARLRAHFDLLADTTAARAKVAPNDQKMFSTWDRPREGADLLTHVAERLVRADEEDKARARVRKQDERERRIAAARAARPAGVLRHVGPAPIPAQTGLVSDH